MFVGDGLHSAVSLLSARRAGCKDKAHPAELLGGRRHDIEQGLRIWRATQALISRTPLLPPIPVGKVERGLIDLARADPKVLEPIGSLLIGFTARRVERTRFDELGDIDETDTVVRGIRGAGD